VGISIYCFFFSKPSSSAISVSADRFWFLKALFIFDLFMICCIGCILALWFRLRVKATAAVLSTILISDPHSHPQLLFLFTPNIFIIGLRIFPILLKSAEIQLFNCKHSLIITDLERDVFSSGS
jgi:hypothetical protein